MLTRAFATGRGGEQAKPIAVAEDRDSLANGWPLLEADVGYNVADLNVLHAHAYGDQTAGRRPVLLPELVLRGDTDPSIGTFDVGDDVRIVLPADEFHWRGVDTRMRLIVLALEPGEDAEKVTVPATGLLDDVAQPVNRVRSPETGRQGRPGGLGGGRAQCRRDHRGDQRSEPVDHTNKNGSDGTGEVRNVVRGTDLRRPVRVYQPLGGARARHDQKNETGQHKHDLERPKRCITTERQPSRT